MSRLVLFIAMYLICTHAFAATEYLRFEGVIIGNYESYKHSPYSGYDESLGFRSDQQVYFDFRVDTSIDSLIHPDYYLNDDFLSEDNFDASYLSGSFFGQQTDAYGKSSYFPEGITTWLFITDSLRVGSSHDSLFPYPDDESIGQWEVGESLYLMNNGYSHQAIIGYLSLTYRGTVAPAAYVPLPAAFWLFATGLLALLGFKARINNVT